MRRIGGSVGAAERLGAQLDTIHFDHALRHVVSRWQGNCLRGWGRMLHRLIGTLRRWLTLSEGTHAHVRWRFC